MIKLKKGMIVTIYQDPRARKKPEGKAQLIQKHLHWSSASSEFWVVRFLGEGDREVNRRIYTQVEGVEVSL